MEEKNDEIYPYNYCPDCGQLKMKTDQEHNYVCENCGARYSIDDYLLSWELFQKELLLQLIEEFVQPGYGKCISYNNANYIVGFDSEGQLVIEPYQLQQGEEEGMWVRISLESENLQEE